MKRYVMIEIDSKDLTEEDVEDGKYALLNRAARLIYESATISLIAFPEFANRTLYSRDNEVIEQLFQKAWEEK